VAPVDGGGEADGDAGPVAVGGGAAPAVAVAGVAVAGVAVESSVTVCRSPSGWVGAGIGTSPPLVPAVSAGAGGYAFSGVPDGKYVVLAPFGLTGDVRDVSGTGNTEAAKSMAYDLLGWDRASGLPTQATLNALGLSFIIPRMEAVGIVVPA